MQINRCSTQISKKLFQYYYYKFFKSQNIISNFININKTNNNSITS